MLHVLEIRSKRSTLDSNWHMLTKIFLTISATMVRNLKLIQWRTISS